MPENQQSEIPGIDANHLLRVDMESYLSKHRIVYRAPPMHGWEGFPVGNGSLGGMYWAAPDGCVFQANHANALEERDPDDRNEGWAVLRSCGRMTVRYPFPMHDWLYINRYYASLSLSDAIVKTRVEGAFGSFESEHFVHAELPVAFFRFRAEYAGALADGGAPVRLELDRWGSRVFGWWYAHAQGGASMDTGETTSYVDGNDIGLQTEFRGVDVSLRCRMLGRVASVETAHSHRAEVTIGAEPVQEFVACLACATSRETTDPDSVALGALDEATKGDPSGSSPGELLGGHRSRHRRWWASYWNRSFLSVSPDYHENLYYLHLYLMGSGSRGLYPPLFNGGVWTWNHDVRNWVNPHHWNQQQSFWPLPAANRSDFLAPYLDTYDRLRSLAEDVTSESGYRGLRWSETHDYEGHHHGLQSRSFKDNHTVAAQIALFFWWHYRYTGDRARFIEQGWPFLRAVGEFFVNFVVWNDERDEYEIPLASTYEDERPYRFTNSITTLAMAKRVLSILEHARVELGPELPGGSSSDEDDESARRRHVLDHLPDYMINTRDQVRGATLASGFVDGNELPERETHNHGPLFCPVFPAGEIGLTHRGKPLFAAAVNTLATYPTSVAAITPTIVIAARLGRADIARQRLSQMVRNLQQYPNGTFFNIDHWHIYSRRVDIDLRERNDSHYWANRNYVPDDASEYQRDYLEDRAVRFSSVNVHPYEHDDVIEHRADHPADPFSQMGMESLGNFATGLQEMLLQSHDGALRVFPAVPDEWEGAFSLLAEGGFFVSSKRPAYGPAEWIEVRSTRGGSCTVVLPWSRELTVSLITDDGSEGSAIALGSDIGAMRFRRGDEEIVTFDTDSGHAYLLRPSDIQVVEIARYEGRPNEEPKTYFEARLGLSSLW